MPPRSGGTEARPPLAPPPEPASGPLPRRSGDGSFSLWCPRTGEAFHSADGALAEARRVFVQPAALERFAAGSRLRVVEVAVGTGTNTAALLEAAADRGLELDWWGLELDPAPLRLALAAADFRSQWRPRTLERLQQLAGGGRLRWGDARSRVAELLSGLGPVAPDASGGAQAWQPLAGRCDLVLLDAFSPQRCPGLWSLEFLGQLAGLLAPGGRLLTYCSAAAVRRALECSGLQLAAIDRARVLVKVPLTRGGCETARRLIEAGVSVTFTACYEVHQVLIAAALGARYVAPYLGRISDGGRDGHGELIAMQRCLDGLGSSTRLLVASLRRPDDLARLAAAGMGTFTFGPDLAAALFASEATAGAAAQFETDAAAAQFERDAAASLSDRDASTCA